MKKDLLISLFRFIFCITICLQACSEKISKYTLEDFQQLSESKKSRTKIRYYMFLKSAQSKSKQKNIKGAYADYQEALRIRPKYSDAYFYRGLLKQQQEKYLDALQDYEQALRFKGGSPAMIYFQSAQSRYALNDYGGAIEDCNRAALMYPFYAEAYYLRGKIKMRLKYYDGAIQDLKKTVRIYRRYPEAYFSLGVCFWYIGQKDAATGFFEKAFEQGYLQRIFRKIIL